MSAVRSAIWCMAIGLLLGPGLQSLAQDRTSGTESEKIVVPQIFWDKNPRIVVYQIRRLSNKQLVRLELKDDDPQYKPGYEAILDRPGLHRKLRQRAVIALAKLNKTSPMVQIIAALQRFDRASESSGHVLHDLIHMLGMQKAADLSVARKALDELASGSEKPIIRQVGYFAVLAAGASVDEVWKSAMQNKGQVDLIGSMPLIKDSSVRQALYGRIKPLVSQARDDLLRRAAIDAVSYVPGHESEVFDVLTQLIVAGKDRAAAVRSISRIDFRYWTQSRILPVARSLVQYIEKTPAARRTEPAAIDAIQLGQDLAGKLPVEQATPIRKALRSLGVQIVLLRTVPHEMLYDRKYFAVEAGKPVQLIFENNDIMPHNVVVVSTGAVEEIGMAAEAMQPSADPKARQFVPDSPKVLASSMLIAGDQRTAINFNAPDQPGEYPYVCTFPGHWRRMYGVMVVVSDLDAYLAKPKVPMDPLTGQPLDVPGGPWAIEDLKDSLSEIDHGRDFQQGKAIFTELGCAQCHKMAGKGGVIGPDLTEVFKRWKANRQDVLREIIDPSKVINEKFVAYLVDTLDGESLFGVIIEQDKNSILMVTNPSDPKPRRISKDDIIEKRKAPASLMPKGLLDKKRHSKQQVLDLLGYLEAGGNADHDIYKK